jgi:glycogen debranching enzyme
MALEQAPQVLAEASNELLVSKGGSLFVCSRPNGDIHPGFATGEGLYSNDTRHLSEFRVVLGGTVPVLLSTSVGSLHKATIHAANPDLWDDKGLGVPQLTIIMQRSRLVADRLYERIDLVNNGRDPARTTLEVYVAADFADIFEVRGKRQRLSQGELLEPVQTDSRLCFAWQDQDGVVAQTDIWLDPSPERLDLEHDGGHISWDVALAPRGRAQFNLSVGASDHGFDSEKRSLELAEEDVRRAIEQWDTSCTSIQTDSRLFSRLTRTSSRDLRALVTPVGSHRVVTAGIPWFVAPFGRDSLIACYETLLMVPHAAGDTLRFLAAHQAAADEGARDAEPGKIMHELRRGPLARAKQVPHTPYYGSIDATPLFMMLAAAYFRWTADLNLMAELRPSLDRALSWIAHHGDRDGDGFIEYERRSQAGLDNQGWKDSWDAIAHADGTLAEGPIALVEAQAYVFAAKLGIADVYDALGVTDVAGQLRSEAAELKKRFNEAYWMPEEGTYALALDGRKRQVRSVTSNPGHALFCGIADEDKGANVAQRLMAPDMFSGWGVRTLSTESPAYNPISYHNGSIWPHDNAIVAAGLKQYGFADATEKISTALFEAAVDSSESRLMELYCGFSRDPELSVVPYPVACRPQAWAAAAPLMLLQAMLGISANAPRKDLTVDRPALPAWLRRVELKNLRVGNSQVDLAFTRRLGENTSISLTKRQGDLQVTIRQ